MKDAVKISSAVCHRSLLSEKTFIVQHTVMWCDAEAVHRRLEQSSRAKQSTRQYRQTSYTKIFPRTN